MQYVKEDVKGTYMCKATQAFDLLSENPPLNFFKIRLLYAIRDASSGSASRDLQV